MKRHTRMRLFGGIPGAVACILCAASAFAARNVSFDRYEVILIRRPFGEPPSTALVAPPKPVTPPQESFVRDLRLCALSEDDYGELRVGIVNIKTKDSYFLGLGDSQDGIEVADADFQSESALLRQGEEEYWISMDGSAYASGADGGGDVSLQVEPSRATPSRRISYRERLKLRRQAEVERRLQQEPLYVGEELEKHLQTYQMEVIRQGLPALPIPLTPEMDDQLVAEGVLPPLDEGF